MNVVYIVEVESRYEGDNGSVLKVYANREDAIAYSYWLGIEKHLYSKVYEKKVLQSRHEVTDAHKEVKLA